MTLVPESEAQKGFRSAVGPPGDEASLEPVTPLIREETIAEFWDEGHTAAYTLEFF